MSKKGNHRTLHVLIVEDSEVIRNMARSILEFHKYKISSAKNGAEGLKLFKEDKPDLVFMDLAMPVMGGIECLEGIKELEKNNSDEEKTPVIALTGNAEFYTPKEFARAGFKGFIEKPIDFDGMSKILRKYLDMIENNQTVDTLQPE